MGFFDDLFADVKAFTDEIEDIKQELVSAVLEPTNEFRETATDISSKLKEKNPLNSIKDANASNVLDFLTKK